MENSHNKPDPRIGEIILKSMNENKDLEATELLEFINQRLRIAKLPLLIEEDQKLKEIAIEIIGENESLDSSELDELIVEKINFENLDIDFDVRGPRYWWCYCARHGHIATSRNYSFVAKKRLNHLRTIPYPFHLNHIRTFRDSA